MLDISSPRSIYPTKLSCLVNNILFPLKMILPQSLVAKIPMLLTNEEIRLKLVYQQLRGRVLDIGCGNNRLLQHYRANGGEGLGVDVYPWEGVDVVVHDTAHLDLPDGTFDTVTFVACFNHIPNREATLREAHRLLSAGGRVVLTNLPPLVSRIWHARNYFWSRDQRERGMKEGEVWGFKRRELLRIFERNGFQLENSRRFSWNLNQLYVLRRAQGAEASGREMS